MFKKSFQVSYDAGRTILDKNLDLGLYYMDEGAGIDMIDLVFLGKASNTNPVPGKAQDYIKRIFGGNF